MPKPDSVIRALEATSAEHGNLAAMRYKSGGIWHSVTWKEYLEQVEGVSRGLIGLGLEPGNSTVILADNCPRWFSSHFGSIAAGAIPAGIYANNTPDQCRFVADHCHAKVAFVGNLGYLEIFLQIRHQLPRLEAIVLMEGDADKNDVYSWSDLLELGHQTSAESFRQRCEALQSGGVCELIYTSGTTGTPKAVMLTHRNITWIAEQLTPIWELQPGEALISYLPLSHIAEQVIALYNPVFTGTCTWFAENPETLGENLREVRPHVFFAVPRVWEKIQTAIEAAAAQSSGLQRRLGIWARHQGLAGGYAEQHGRPRPALYRLAEKLVFNRVRQRLGLDRCRLACTAAAPISLHTLEYFLSIGIPILEIYGMSENTGPATISTPDRYRTGKAGWAIPGTELKVAEDGEICIRGPHVSPGYFRDSQATRETFDEEGWLHSGDIGQIDSEGFLTIVDRKKELIITSGGKNVAPQAIEKELESIAAVGQAVVLGDRRNYLVALLTLDPDRLIREAEKIGSPARDAAAAASCERMRHHLEERIQAINSRLARFETIKRFLILPVDFSVAGGELTPTMKLKRRVVSERYAAEIEDLYAQERDHSSA